MGLAGAGASVPGRLGVPHGSHVVHGVHAVSPIVFFRDSPFLGGGELINKDGNPVNSVNHVVGRREQLNLAVQVAALAGKASR
jgi:hypothetical protein